MDKGLLFVSGAALLVYFLSKKTTLAENSNFSVSGNNGGDWKSSPSQPSSNIATPSGGNPNYYHPQSNTLVLSNGGRSSEIYEQGHPSNAISLPVVSTFAYQNPTMPSYNPTSDFRSGN
jgi:hypothetical protein